MGTATLGGTAPGASQGGATQEADVRRGVRFQIIVLILDLRNMMDMKVETDSPVSPSSALMFLMSKKIDQKFPGLRNNGT